MQVAGTMIGTAGSYTFSGVVQQDGEGRFVCEARVFDHPDPAVTIPSGTTPKHVVTAEAASRDEAVHALETALSARLGALRWARWRFAEGRGEREANDPASPGEPGDEQVDSTPR